ncbi:hypothetical protein MSG28_011021, partial [Choristoneura fumiferana]
TPENIELVIKKGLIKVVAPLLLDVASSVRNAAADLAIKYLGQSRILDILPRYLDLTTFGNDIVTAVLQCLIVVVEDNPPAMEKIKSNSEGQLQVLLSLESDEPSILLVKTLSAGVIINTCGGNISSLPGNVISQIISILAKTLSVDHRQACNQLSSNVPLPASDGKVAAPKGKAAQVLENHIKSVSQILDAQQNADDSLDGEESSDSEEMGDDEPPCNGESSILAEDKLPTEVLEALITLDIFDKIWTKTQLPAENVAMILKEYEGSSLIYKKLQNLQTRSLLCVNNMLASLPLDNLGGVNGVYKIWVEAGKLVFKQNSDAILLESATAVMRASLDKIKLRENGSTNGTVLFSDLAVSDLEMMFTGIRECNVPEIRSNLIRMIGLLALLLVNSLNETTANVICTITDFILDQAHKENEVWVLAEALDTIIDLYSEDETDVLAAKLNLVDKLSALAPIMKNKARQQKKLPKEFRVLVSTVISNLPRFIKYKKGRISEPDWYLYYYNWDKGKVESHAKAQNPSGQGTVESINITSCMWLSPDRILIGTDNGVIMMIENGELRQNCIFQAFDITEMSLKKVESTEGAEESGDKTSTSSKQETTSDQDSEGAGEVYPLLSTRMSELETEHTYQLRQAEATQAEKLKEVHEGYCAAIEELKEKNENLEDKTARMRKDYEQRLEDLAESKRQALREMNNMFEAKLEEKELVLQELQEQTDMEKREHETIKSSIEEDADREIIEIRTAYEVQLKEEKDANIEPKERTIRELRTQIDDMENEELKLLNFKHDLELKINQLTEKLSSAKKDFLSEADRNLTLKNTLKKIKIDLHNMTANFQDPMKLKLNVKENCTLLTEINNLRTELKSTRTRCFQMESILGLSARYIPPATARAKLKHVTEDREQLDEKFKQKIEGGKTFVIKNQADFARELLPLYYKHNNMASFIRQLNMYGFHKITSVENGGLRYEKDEIEFSHPCFVKNQSYLLEHIKRKIANPKTIVTSGESGEKILIKPELMNKVLTDVKQMKGKQESLDAKFSAMKQENEALWREVAILRQKHIKQQQIVNNLIQFLMSLVQPARPNNANSNNVGVKRPYQLMINSAAHNHGEGAYPGRVKNIKLDKDSILEDINEDNQEDGPTIHELAHDDVLHSEIAEDSLNPANFVSIDTEIPCSFSPHNPNSMQIYPVTKVNSTLPQTLDVQPVVTSPSPTIVNPTSPLDQTVLDQVFIDPSTIIREKMRKTPRNTNKQVKKMTPANSFNNLNPAADPKLPADIFADDDSVENCLGAGDSIFQSALHNAETDPMVSTSKDKMFGGINIKVEKGVNPKTSKKSKKSNKDTPQLNLADIKTELQDDLDWNNMSLATVNNNSDVNRFNSMTDIDDHLDSMQTDIESLRELLRSDSYALDTNTLMGLFGSDDPFYGLSYNPVDERAKASNSAEGNQLMSYTGNMIPCLEDMNLELLENSQEAVSPSPSPSPSPSNCTLNTPQVQVASPAFPQKR